MFFQIGSTNGGTSLGQFQKSYPHLPMKDLPKAFPILQRHAYVKWWSQFDLSMAYPEKAQIQAALAASQLKQSIKGEIQQILHLLQEDEESSSKEESDEEGKDRQVEEDCFEVYLADD
ncbi:uncharacterized protein DS421_18g620620 [Arachis hypogaea]|nr:uncharacterized protein DS421_18g620620 [Arachis hypogaea]